MIDWNEISEKWSKKWLEEKTFEAEPDKRKKFFINFPYPYINSYLHLGHAFSLTRVDVFARYKRMQGFNVLFAQGWHCTGTPVWAAAQRVIENEPKQIKILESLGFKRDEIKKFADVKHWIDVFVPAAKEDLQKLGASADWRRSFITTELNPRYDKFIRWQFRKLLEKKYVGKGNHPVVWCPKDNMPVGDHDRVEGEGETPQEYVLFKQRLPDGKYVISATLKPETVLGVTNLFVNPDSELVEAQVGNEVWILSEKAANELGFQDKKVKILAKIKGISLIGKKVKEFSGLDAMILPADFVSESVGTGIVHSCPSDSSDDLIALIELQNNEQECKKYGLEIEEVRRIQPIPIINVPGYGPLPADDMIKKLGIKSQNELDKLQKAKEMLYADEFYKGTFNEKYSRNFKKDYSGKKLIDHKDEIKKELIENSFADIYFQPTGNVVCRCLTECVVKKVSDQWFLKYGNRKWKEDTWKALSKMKLFPELSRTQFNHVIGWLNDWACTHHHGTGTKLPWDEKWVIESLSDSTIYMAFYTISHILNEIPADEINDELFDYVFLGKNKHKKEWEKMKKEFEYWYPFDVRSSGKDLIQNHLSFCLFNHTAIFPEKYWPKAFSVNGWLLVEGEKMSKSKGNFFTIREIIEMHPSDVVRASLMLGGEGLNDPNFDMTNAKSMKEKLEQFFAFAKENYRPARKKALSTHDKIFLSAINRVLKESTEAMEEMLFRTAFEKLFFQMQRALKEYEKKQTSQELINEFIEIQVKAIAPFCPFIAEEIWHSLGKKDLIAGQGWPKYDGKKIDEEAEAIGAFIDNTRKDIIEILKLTKTDKPKKIRLFIAEQWKYDFVGKIKEEMEKTRNSGEIIKKLASTSLKNHGQEISKMVPRFVNDPGKLPVFMLSHEKEMKILKDAAKDFKKEFQCEFEIGDSEKSDEQKAKQAFPFKVAILVE